ncbi:MAG: S-layer homology domain-containing protein [Anaerocolumna sp.]
MLVSTTVGGVVYGGGNYNVGNPATVHAVANEGYTFTGWSDSNGNTISGSEYYSFIIGSSDIFLVANFTLGASPLTLLPTINNPVSAGVTSISGTAEAGANIMLSINGIAQPGVNTSASGSWTVSGLALVEGDTISVTAHATGKAVSLPQTATVVSQGLQTQPPTITLAYYGDTSISGTAVANAAITLSLNNTTRSTTADVNGNWIVSGLSLFAGESISATAQSTGVAVSTTVTTTVLSQTPAPVINTPVYAGTTSISGTAMPNATIVLSINGTAQPAVNATATGAWTVSALTTLTTGDIISVTAQSPGVTVSSAQTTTVVGQAVSQTLAPTVNTPLYAGATKVSGTAEVNAAVTLSNNGVLQQTVNASANGFWTVDGLTTLSKGDIITVIAQTPGKTASQTLAAVVAAQGSSLVISPTGGSYEMPLSVTISDGNLLADQTVYYSTAGDPASVIGANRFEDGATSCVLTLDAAATVYARVYSNGTWGSLVSTTYKGSATTYPLNPTVEAGNAVTFGVDGVGNYQWQVSIDGGSTWNNITGAILTYYSTGALSSDNNGSQYRCLINGMPSAASIVTVTLGLPTVSEVTLTPANVSVQKGSTYTFAASVTGTNNPSQDVTWSVTGSSSVGTYISSVGVLTVAADETAALTVRAISDADNEKSGTAAVTVTEVPVTVNSVIITPKTVTVVTGSAITFSAAVVGTNNPSQDVNWSVSGNSSLSTTISNTGELTIAVDETALAFTVTAVSDIDNTKFDTAAVTITSTPEPAATVSNVAITPDSVSIIKGNVFTFSAAVTGTNNPSQAVSWSVTGNNNAGTIINSSGVLAVAAGETSTTLTVTAVSAVDSTKTDTAEITVADASSTVPTVDVVAINPTTASVAKGGTKAFNAVVTGSNSPAQTVLWSISGNVSAATQISSSGLLTVGADETALTLTVSAVSTVDSSQSAMAAVTVTSTSLPTAAVSYVVVSAASNSVQTGKTKTFTAAVAGTNNPSQEVTWSVSGNNSANTVISNTGVLTVGADETAASLTVTATSTQDNTKSGTATIVMVYPAPDTSSGGGSSSGSGSSGSSSRVQNPTVQLEKKPDQPVITEFSITAKADKAGLATVEVSEASIASAVKKAQDTAKEQGKTENGIGVTVNIVLPDTAKSAGIILTQPTLKTLIDAEVKQLELNGTTVALSFDLEALKEIQKQSNSNEAVIISFTPATGLSGNAKTLIGTRPVYNISITYVKNEKTISITSLGSGSVTLSIPYTLGKKEAVGYLFGVYVDSKGNAARMEGSAYDTNSKSIIFDSNHFSIYGVGYTAPSTTFKDISTHWAKEAIDYVVGRGLFSGTSTTAFSPDTAMSRGMLVTALGRLAGVGASEYKTVTFTDVAADQYYAPYIEWAYQKGIISGTGSSQFAPERTITREEMARILSNYAKATGYILPVTREAAAYADDSSIGSTYKDAVKALQQAGIMMGGDGNTFKPKANVTRSEVSAMLHRYIKLTIDPATAQGWAVNDAGQHMYYKDGKVLTGWKTIESKKYFFNSDSALQTGWKQDDKGNWYYLLVSGAKVGWQNIGSGDSKKRYYFNTDAIMVFGKWFQIGGKWYYFNANGSLAVSTKIDGYEVDKNGVRKTK